MTQPLKRFPLLLFFLALILLAAGVVRDSISSEKKQNVNQHAEFQRHLLKREKALDRDLADFAAEPCRNFASYAGFPEKWRKKSHNEGLAFYRYTIEDLLFWTDNAVPVGLNNIQNYPVEQLWKLKNGWYLARRIQGAQCSVLGLALIRQDYSYQNDYLTDGYPGANELLNGSSLSKDPEPGSYPVRDRSGKTIGWFSPVNKENLSSTPDIPLVWLIVSGIFLLFISVHTFVYNLPEKGRKWAAPLWWLCLFALRWISFFFEVPGALYMLPLFSPGEFGASNWLPSLGDLFINSLMLLYTAFLLHRWQGVRKPDGKYPLIFLKILIVVVGMFYGWLCCDLLRDLIINSSISLDIKDFLSLSSGSFVSFLIISFLFASLFLLIDKSMNILKSFGAGRNEIVILVCALTVAGFFFQKLYNDHDAIILPGIMLVMLSVYFAGQGKHRYVYSSIIGVIAIFACLGTYMILNYTYDKEHEKRKLLASKISAERDPIAESLFLETEKKILSDTLLKSYLRPGTIPTSQVRDLAQLYFNGFWEKYSISVNVFGADECPMTALYTSPVNDPLVFDKLIDSIGIPTLSDRFFFLDNGSGRISYFARVQIREQESDSIPMGTLYIRFDSRYTPEEIGYPELLLDKMVSSNTDLSSYSYARYTDGKLISHYGQYPYGLSDALFQDTEGDQFTKNRYGNFSHLVHKPDEDSMVIMSLPLKGPLDILTPFSYLMLFFGFLVMLPFVGREFWKKRKLRHLTFKRRVQLSIILILFLSLILIGGGTILYIISNNNLKNNRNISEKIHSMLVETEYLLHKDPTLNSLNADDIAYELTRQANVFFADLNIFDRSGVLFASSRPKIFEEGLISKKMNPDAFYNLSVLQTTEFVHEEYIGGLRYLSAYVPLRNNENKVTGYLNLPYFARQNELRKEVASFVIAIINIYVLLIVLVLIAAIFLSNTVTEPLRLIQERLGNIQLGRKNEIIEWKGNDEIAELIREYNRMVSELAESADKLARSERESAWREMAKQVSHEIKNPLTPMKLSTQLLKRAWDDKAPGFEERLERFSNNLIEQIDTLSHIATAFSNFAKMPEMVKEKVDLAAILHSAIDFHKGEEGVDIKLELTCNQPCNVLSDKEQLLRVFNNLLRNAIQAIPAEKDGVIEVILSREEDSFLVEIKDNGNGIEEELREKIFYPNFTTKSTGMGLGLALVKNIVETSEGTVWFESEPGKGTSFFVKLKEINVNI